MIPTRVLSIDDAAAIVAAEGIDGLMDQLIERLTTAFATHDPELLVTHDRDGFHYVKPALGLLEWMPAMECGRRVAIKTVGYHPTNPVQRSLPSVLATTSLYDVVTGQLLAIAESTFLTALRTGAASGVATDILATDGPVTLGVIGAGAQAVTQIHAISRVRELERVMVFDVQTDVAATLADRLPMSDLPVEVVAGDHLDQLLAASHVLCTCTSVDPDAGPVLADGPHREELHINAVGADFAGKVELPVELVRRALVCPDVVSQCLIEGESQQLEESELGPDLAELVRDRAQYSSRAGELTVFDSTGWSLEDLVAIELMLDLADRHDVGQRIELQPNPDDPYDPYEAVMRSLSRRS